MVFYKIMLVPRESRFSAACSTKNARVEHNWGSRLGAGKEEAHDGHRIRVGLESVYGRVKRE